MRCRLIVTLVIGALLSGSLVEAAPGDRFRERMRQRFAARAAAAEAGAPQAPPAQTIAYGGDAAQNLDFWPAQGVAGTNAAPGAKVAQGARVAGPLVVFVHGGGWRMGSKDNATGKWKAVHFPREGYGFASINYRLVPQATVEDQAGDIARALAALVARADGLGIDRRRIVLMGHSAGAQLVALVGSDERYLKAAGLSFADVAGVVAIDGAAYDVPAQMADGPQMMQRIYGQAFGDDPVRQRALSPTMQAAAPNAARFLLLHVQRADGVRQSEALAKALRDGGSAVAVESLPGEGLKGHVEINRRLGDPDYAATVKVDEWLKRALGG